MVTSLNPKAAMFFTAFLPQFVDPAGGAVPTQLLVLGLFAMLVGTPVYLLYIITFVTLGRRFGGRKYTSSLPLLRLLDGICGALYLAFATGLAFWKRA